MADGDRHWTAERVALTEMYPGKKWAQKVMKMNDQQVHEVLVNIRKRREKQKNG